MLLKASHPLTSPTPSDMEEKLEAFVPPALPYASAIPTLTGDPHEHASLSTMYITSKIK